jgi:hypothetical protein
MTPGEAMRAALGDMYRQSWRLFLLNAALSTFVVSIALAGLWVPVLWLLLLGAGPLAAALMHCAVVLTRTEELRLVDALTGLRRHWRRGLVLAAVVGAATFLAVHAISFYAGRGALVLAVVGAYLLFAFAVFQLVLWPLAVVEEDRPFRTVASDALRAVLARPMQAFVLALALVAVNLAGIAAAVLPFLTLTIAYTFLASARFALPPDFTLEEHD